jgi:5-methylcytosine-specific restriction endonuclease McrA
MNKTCQECGVSFYTSSISFVLCKECRKKPKNQSSQSRRYYALLRPLRQPTAIDTECPYCGTTFVSAHRGKIFCGKTCVELFKNDRVIFQKMQMGKRQRYKHIAKERVPPTSNVACERCGKEFSTKHKTQKYCSKTCSDAMQELRKTLKRQEARPVLECAYCGNTFKAICVRSKYCSPKCERKQHDTVHKLRKRGCARIEQGITLKKLRTRDKDICHICGGKTNINDNSRNESGFFVAGNTYPTIDHVMPLAKGGNHTWDNVKLAHLKCNGAKSDHIEFESKKGQMQFAI